MCILGFTFTTVMLFMHNLITTGSYSCKIANWLTGSIIYASTDERSNFCIYLRIKQGFASENITYFLHSWSESLVISVNVKEICSAQQQYGNKMRNSTFVLKVTQTISLSLASFT